VLFRLTIVVECMIFDDRGRNRERNYRVEYLNYRPARVGRLSPDPSLPPFGFFNHELRCANRIEWTKNNLPKPRLSCNQSQKCGVTVPCLISRLSRTYKFT